MKVSTNVNVNKLRVRGERKHGENPNPVMLFPKRCIDDAVYQAKKVSKIDGRPTRDAMNARSWIDTRPEWNDKDAWLGSFEWCCHWYFAGVFKPEHCEKIRAEKLAEIDLALTVAARNWRDSKPMPRADSEVDVRAAKRVKLHENSAQLGFCWA